MKSRFSNFAKKSWMFFVTIWITYSLISTAFAQISDLDSQIHSSPFDHVINQKGESRVSFFTGLPVVASTEFAYGISNRLTAGVFFGYTPFEEAIGIRVRTVLYEQTESFRIYYCTPVIYYPQTRRLNPDPWFLTRPNINFEWMKTPRLRYKFGGSIIASSSQEDLFGDPSKSRHSPGLWTAVHGGISTRMGSGLSFQAELSYVMKGLQTIDSFFGGPPFILMTGFSYTF